MIDSTQHISSGFVFSDLHVLSSHTDYTVINAMLDSIPDSASYIVMNGDIFDFIWSEHPEYSETLDQASRWIQTLLEKHEKKKIYYIMGNHDCGQIWADKLSQIDHPNFQWSPSHFIINHSLFLHGDIPLSSPHASPLERLHAERLPRKSPFPLFDGFYNKLLDMKLHIPVSNFNTPERIVPRIHCSLERHAPDTLNHIEHIYFGHTHKPFSDFHYKGKRFHNTGSSVRHILCNALETAHE